jgi:lipopolysaccharide transport system ATP-binding protein
VAANGYVSIQASPEGGDTIWALKDLSFEIRPGEMWGIIGRNGSGKSTLLKILSGITEPTDGRAEVRGRVGSLLEVGTGIHPELTGRENIYLSGTISGLSRREITQKFHAIVAFAELEKFIDTPVKHYSTGMHMRLGFAVASHLDPHVMLVDEALAVGDLQFQKKCRDHLKRLHRAGMTIVFISHAMEEIEDLCDYAIWLDKGLARAQGRCAGVTHAYLKEIHCEQLADSPEAELRTQAEAEAAAHISDGLKQELKEVIKLELRDELKAELDGEHKQDSIESPHEPRRWGSREVEIVGVRLYDAQGNEQRLFATGAEMIVELVYNAHDTIERPVFGIAISPREPTSQGAMFPCAGVSNSKWTNQIIPSIRPGRGTVRCSIPCLPFYKGYHYLDVCVHSELADVYYDYQENAYNFYVDPTGDLDSEGYLYLPAQWEYPDADANSAEHMVIIPDKK